MYKDWNWKQPPQIEKESTYRDDLSIIALWYRNKFVFHMLLRDTGSWSESWNRGPQCEFYIRIDELYSEVEATIKSEIYRRAFNLVKLEDDEKFQKRISKMETEIIAELSAPKNASKIKGKSLEIGA